MLTEEATFVVGHGSGGHEVCRVSSTRSELPELARRFIDSLTSEECMLVVLKRELYEGNWDEMVADLRARLEGRPYIFRLAHRIIDDIERIKRLRAFERDHDVDLSEFVDLDE